MEEHVFNKELVTSRMTISKRILADYSFKSTEYDSSCLIRNELAFQLESFLYKKTISEKVITYHFERPSFLDWLFRRTKTKTVKINIDDALLNPPKMENTVRLYNLEQLD